MDKRDLLAEEARKGRQANAIIADPLWVAMWAEHRAQVLGAWERAQDTALRESLWGELALATKLRRKIERYAQTGVMAEQELQAAKPETH